MQDVGRTESGKWITIDIFFKTEWKVFSHVGVHLTVSGKTFRVRTLGSGTVKLEESISDSSQLGQAAI